MFHNKLLLVQKTIQLVTNTLYQQHSLLVSQTLNINQEIRYAGYKLSWVKYKACKAVTHIRSLRIFSNTNRKLIKLWNQVAAVKLKTELYDSSRSVCIPGSRTDKQTALVYRQTDRQTDVVYRQTDGRSDTVVEPLDSQKSYLSTIPCLKN